MEYQIKLQKHLYEDGKVSARNVSRTINEIELKFEFPIRTSEDLNYFLECLNENDYRDIVVCTKLNKL